MPDSRPFVVAVSMEPLDASTSIFFGHLFDVAPEVIRVIRHGDAGLPAALAAASAVVCVRDLFGMDDVVRAARALGLPLYYFLDDNFIVLQEQGDATPWVRPYSDANVRAALQRFTGVLVATPAIDAFFTQRSLHSRRLLFPPVRSVTAASAPSEPRRRLHVAFFGGAHLHQLLLTTILPAVERLAGQRPVTLITLGAPPIRPSAGLQVVQHPYDVSYDRGLATLSAFGVDVLAHPSAADLPNNIYKNPHALITAQALGAVPVVSDAEPYSGLRGEGVARLCGNDEESWYQALAAVADDQQLRSEMIDRLARYCGEHFSGADNRRALESVLPGPRGRSAATSLWRHWLAWSYLIAGVARRSMSRMKHRFGAGAAAA